MTDPRQSPTQYLRALADAFWREHPERERVKYVRLIREPYPRPGPGGWVQHGNHGLLRVRNGELHWIGRIPYRAVKEAEAAGEVIERVLTFDEAWHEWCLIWPHKAA